MRNNGLRFKGVYRDTVKKSMELLQHPFGGGKYFRITQGRLYSLKLPMLTNNRVKIGAFRYTGQARRSSYAWSALMHEV